MCSFNISLFFGMASRQRKRKRCLKCNQELSHSAYVRHQNPVVCPARNPPPVLSSTTLKSTVEISNPVSDLLGVASASDFDVRVFSPSPTEETSDSSSESESDSITGSSEGVAIFSDDSTEEELLEVPTELQGATNTSREQMKLVATHICLFISFFQLCYRIPERGISLLLNFLRAFLYWLSSLVPSSNFLLLRDMLPKNVYFLRKLCGSGVNITTYVMCPKCHFIYHLKDSIITNRDGRTESAKCSYIQYPNHPHQSRRAKCNTVLMKKVKNGSKYKLVPCKVYAYNSLKSSLAKLFGRHGFSQKCELWRNRSKSPDMYTDIYDGLVWENFQVINNRPFLKVPNNLGLILNMDWFNPFKHIEYSVGVIYLVIANIPRSERYKLENVIIVGTIPGPREPKKHVNFYLKPLVEELLELWNGTLLKTSSLFGIVPVRCALICVSCDLPAIRKVCGFTSYSSIQGCSKCMKRFPCESFGTKLDYSGYDRDTWTIRTHALHKEQVKEFKEATTASQHHELERKYGLRYSELLRLPYFDIVEYHVIDPMHNLLLGTGKHLMTLWKESEILTKTEFEDIQEQVDKIKVPANVGRIPHKINSNFSGFTADQWKNWICVYSILCLKETLPSNHYECWSLFVDACFLLIQPSLSHQDLLKADEKLIEFCGVYERLYGKEKCTPNMHMHLHLYKSVLNFGPVHAFWCFPFERYNGVLGSFQKNWVSPELQMTRKFLAYQNLLLIDVSTSLPEDLREFFVYQARMCGEISVGEGSLEQSHIDSLDLLEYKKNCTCDLSIIDASESIMHTYSHRHEAIFNHTEVEYLISVYGKLYPGVIINHVPMIHERFHNFQVFNQRYLSDKTRGSHSSAVCAYWAGINGGILATCEHLRVGVIQYFVRHTISIPTSLTQFKKVVHVFACVHWYQTHLRESWYHHRVLVVSPDMDSCGPATFLPVSRIFSSCAVTSKTVMFDYGEDNVIIAIIYGSKYCL